MRQRIHFCIALVADDQAFVGVEHAEALQHIVDRDLESSSLLEDFPLRRQLGRGGQARPIGLRLVRLDQLFLKIDHQREIARIGEQSIHHGRRDEQHVDGNRDESRLPGGQEKDRERNDRDAGQQEGGGSQMHQAEDAADRRDGHVEDDMSLCVGVAVLVKNQPPDEEHHAERAAEDNRRLEEAGRLGVADRLAARLDPCPPAYEAANQYDRREADRQAVGRDAVMRPSDGYRIHENDEIEKRNSRGKSPDLRLHQARIVGWDTEQRDKRWRRHHIASAFDDAHCRCAFRTEGYDADSKPMRAVDRRYAACLPLGVTPSNRRFRATGSTRRRECSRRQLLTIFL
ncbi:MAG: hypothetical protein ACLPSW_10620 [Roseiarcus sp.]